MPRTRTAGCVAVALLALQLVACGMTPGEGVLVGLGAAAGTATALALAWGVAVEPRLIDVEEHVAEIPALPAAWEGQRVAVIADFQVGMWLDNTGTIRRIVERLVAERPAAVLIAGDFIYHPLGEETAGETREEVEPEEIEEAGEEIAEAVDLVRPLPAAGIPTYAVLGNHDYGAQTEGAVALEWLARGVQGALEAVGVRVLQNEAVPLPPPGAPGPSSAAGGESPLYIVGIGSHYADNDRSAVALAGVPDAAPRIVMMHHPDSFAALPAGTAPLAVAGHTHGGQISLPLMPVWSWMALFHDDEVHANGWIEGYGQPGNRLYVNRGIGFSVAPIRINAVPEVTLFTLRSAPRSTAIRAGAESPVRRRRTPTAPRPGQTGTAPRMRLRRENPLVSRAFESCVRPTRVPI